MTPKAKIWLSSVGVLAVILIVVTVVVFRSMSFTVTQTTQDELTVEQPMQSVVMSLLIADVASKIQKELNIEVLKKTPVSQSGEISPMAFLSAKWNVQIVEDQQGILHNKDLGDMHLNTRMTTTASPKKIVSTTVLNEPSDVLKELNQTLTITPVDPKSKQSPTHIQVTLTNTVRIPYPPLPFIRKIAEKRVAAEQQLTVSTIVKVLKENIESPVGALTGLIPAFSNPPETPAGDENTTEARASEKPANAQKDEEEEEDEEDGEAPVLRSFDDF